MFVVVRLALAISAIILLPACGSRTIKNKKAAFKRAAFSMPSIQTQIDVGQSAAELEAKLTDIPTLIGSRTISIYQISEQPQQLRLALECNQSLEEVDAYYIEQMAYNGWQSVAVIAGDELMQIYKKPQKICVITIRSKKNVQTEIALIISETKAEI